jgi:hypothetical protein
VTLFHTSHSHSGLYVPLPAAGVESYAVSQAGFHPVLLALVAAGQT